MLGNQYSMYIDKDGYLTGFVDVIDSLTDDEDFVTIKGP